MAKKNIGKMGIEKATAMRKGGSIGGSATA